MFKDKFFLCIIPARGGSTRLKYKNIKNLCGKPMIAWAIEAAKDSGIFDTVVVTTDSPTIAAIAKEYGADIHNRPRELATDTALVRDAVVDVLGAFDAYDYVQLLEPTSPLITGHDIRKAAKTLIQKKADFIISLTPVEYKIPMGFAAPMPESERLTNWFPRSIRNRRTQECGCGYHLDGNIYLGKYSIWSTKQDYWDTNIIPYIMSKESFCHVDTETDFKLAEAMLGRREHGTKRHLLDYLK